MESFGATELNGHIINQSIDNQSKSILRQPSITRGMQHRSEDDNNTKSL